MMSNVCKVFKIFDPLPLVRFWQLIYTIKFTQPPLLCLLFGGIRPPPTRCGRHISMAPYYNLIHVNRATSIRGPPDEMSASERGRGM